MKADECCEVVDVYRLQHVLRLGTRSLNIAGTVEYFNADENWIQINHSFIPSYAHNRN
jgi:hypothetical protein